MNTAASYNDIGTVYLKKNDNDEAIKYLLKGLKIREKALGENNIKIANSLYYLGNANYSKI